MATIRSNFYRAFLAAAAIACVGLIGAETYQLATSTTPNVQKQFPSLSEAEAEQVMTFESGYHCFFALMYLQALATTVGALATPAPRKPGLPG